MFTCRTLRSPRHPRTPRYRASRPDVAGRAPSPPALLAGTEGGRRGLFLIKYFLYLFSTFSSISFFILFPYVLQPHRSQGCSIYTVDTN